MNKDERSWGESEKTELTVITRMHKVDEFCLNRLEEASLELSTVVKNLGNIPGG